MGKNADLGFDSNDGKQIWNYEISGDVFSSPCLVRKDYILIAMSIAWRRSNSLFLGTYNGGCFVWINLQEWKCGIRCSLQHQIREYTVFRLKMAHQYGHSKQKIKYGHPLLYLKRWNNVRSPGFPYIYGVDINTGRQNWKFPTMNLVDFSAAIASNMMLIGSRDGLPLVQKLLRLI